MDTGIEEVARIVQDDARERALADLLGLAYSPARRGVDARDAAGNPFELKTSTKKSITTARDFGPKTIQRWKSQYLVSGFGRNLSSGFVFEAIYAFHPLDLGDWFRPHLEYFAKLDEQTLVWIGHMRAGGASEDEILALIDRLHPGTLLNNPTIGSLYCRKHGTPLSVTGAAAELARFVRERPL